MTKWLALVCLLYTPFSAAKQIAIEVLDKDQQAVAGAVVELLGNNLPLTARELPAVMDQIDKQFSPHILVVRKGELVNFPNSDSIKHHVYSFSPAKPFQLKLYKDNKPEPLAFEKSGVVALGCNIHDWMVGYIYVAQSNLYARTNENGIASFDIGENEVAMRVWHPRFQDADIARKITIGGSASNRYQFILTQPLHPDLTEDTDEFSDY